MTSPRRQPPAQEREPAPKPPQPLAHWYGRWYTGTWEEFWSVRCGRGFL